ncbi:MAG: hypothetical protein KF699_11210 [Phycisphaeraceae bacterium]|nr:hypothetical protein [Phycisphaeraceae bacterium]
MKTLATVLIVASWVWPSAAPGQSEPKAEPPAPVQTAPPVVSAPALAPAAPRPPLPASVRNVPYAQFRMELPMIQRNTLEACSGRLAGMAMHVEKNILYVAAPGKNSVEVHDVANSKALQSVGDFSQPSGLLHVPSQSRLIVSNAADGRVDVFNVNEHGLLSRERSIMLVGEAGPMVFDGASQRVWVGHGVFVSCLNPATGEREAEVQLGPSGRVVGLVQSRGRLLAALMGAKGEVAVVDPTSRTVSARWEIEGAGGLGAIAADEANDRVFAVSRVPARLFVLDGATGATIAALDAPADPGGAWYDPTLRKVYISGGGLGGAVGVYAQEGVNRYRALEPTKTDSGSRHSLLVPEHRRLIVSCPGFDSDLGRLFIYQIGP